MIASPNLNNESPALNPEIDTVDGVRLEAKANNKPSRRDLSSFTSMETDAMIRFVIAPDRSVVPDLAQELPGRGLWVRANREALTQVIRKNAFSKAAKAQVVAKPELVDQVHGLLVRRLSDLLGLMKRDGSLLHGFDKVHKAVKSGQVSWLIEASDGAEDGRQKLISLAAAQNNPPKLFGGLKSLHLDLALGQENVIHAALLKGRRDERISFEMRRLSGFEPLVPEDWINDRTQALIPFFDSKTQAVN